MRTTLDIDEDVLFYLKETASLKKTTAGKVVSDLVRQSLEEKGFEAETRNGFVQIKRKPGDPIITPEFIEQLLEETE